jgi:hypothetical protein
MKMPLQMSHTKFQNKLQCQQGMKNLMEHVLNVKHMEI